MRCYLAGVKQIYVSISLSITYNFIGTILYRFAFVGYIVQSNFVFPWAQTLSGSPHPSPDLVPEAQWDAIPLGAKWQIFAVISMLELWDECGGGGVMPHYMNGRQPGRYPPFTLFRDNVHFVLGEYPLLLQTRRNSVDSCSNFMFNNTQTFMIRLAST